MIPRLFIRRTVRVAASAVLMLLAFGLPKPVGVEAQQTGALQGIVREQNRGPMANAQVSIATLRTGTITNVEGRFQMVGVPAGQHEVRVDLIGYRSLTQTVSIAPGQTAVLEFVLEQSAISLDQIVVTATGEQRKVEVGNAVSIVDAAAMAERTAATNIASLIQGNATGVTISGSSGTLGNAMNVKIRGNTSINLSNTPLVYVDGARVGTTARSRGVGGAASDRMQDFLADEIESIEIIKGPAAATLYGTEAAAGVIRITTKRGAAGRGRMMLSTEYSLTEDRHDYPLRAWNPSVDIGPQYKDTTYYVDVLKGSEPVPNAGAFYNPFRTGEKKKVSASASGGTADYTYFTSFDWTDQTGVFDTNAQQAFHGRGNFTFRPSEKLDVSLSNGFASSTTDFNYNDGESWGYIGAVLLGHPEYTPVMRADPNSGGASMLTCPAAFERARTTKESLSSLTASQCGEFDRGFIGSNNFDRLRTMQNQVTLERYTGTVALRYQPIHYNRTRLSLGYDSYTERGYNQIPNSPMKVRDSNPYRSVSHVLGRVFTLEGTTAFNFDLTDDWRSETTFGAQFYRDITEITEAIGRDFPPGAATVGNGATKDAGEGFVEVRTIGFFAQQQFSYADRLFVTPGVRFDDNSAFGAGLGTILYPKISASWVVSGESWFPESLVETLRLRGAWGRAGKQPGPFDATTLLSVTSVSLPDGSTGAGFVPSRRGNGDLKPETGSEIEVGFDADVLNGRLGVEFTYFNKVTNDALVLKPVPPSTGFSQGVWDNVGQVKNTGLEVGVDATLLETDDMAWDLRVSYTHLGSEVTQLDAPIALGGRGFQEHREGYPFGAYFTYPVSLGEDGEVKVAAERVFSGQMTPSYEGSVSSNLSLWGGKVVFYGLLEYMGGHKNMNYTESYQCRTVFGTCAAKYERNADGTPTEMAILKGQAGSAAQPHLFLYEADFAKVRQLSARFALPESWTQRLRAQSGSVSIVGSNLFTFTSYPGTDPEINSQGRSDASQREFFSSGIPSEIGFRFSLVY
jgi:TonB-linked SusC/RagA family outer membrane protein